MAAPLTRRTEPQSEKRRAIEAGVLTATERLLAGGSSYADLSIDRISKEAGISRTAFYFYFRDKRELLTRLAEGVMDELYEQAEAWFAAGTDGPDRLEAALRSIVAVYDEHGVLLRAVVEASTYDEEIAGFWRTVIGRFVDAAAARIEAEQAAGRAAGLDPHATAFVLAWMTERSVHEHLAAPRVDDEALLKALVDVWRRTVYGA
jgi:AcrR family transcriptional regulator